MITFENVSKIYDNGYGALKGVSFHINKGEFVFLVGSSAAGKSTIIKLMMKEESATGGNIIINDIDVNDLRHKESLISEEPLVLFFRISVFFQIKLFRKMCLLQWKLWELQIKK